MDTPRYPPLATWIEAPLRGLGQVMFQDSAITGAFFLVGIAVASPLMAFGAILGALIGTLTALLLRYDQQEITDGLYGFNAALVGIAVLFYHKFVGTPWVTEVQLAVLFVLGCAVSAAVTYVMRRHVPFPTYTAPFIVTTWVVLYFAGNIGMPRREILPGPVTLEIGTGILEGLSEVMFQASIPTGVLFLVGILCNSWKGVVWALLGSMIGLLIALWDKDPEPNISVGIYGYNAALQDVMEGVSEMIPEIHVEATFRWCLTSVERS